MRIYGLSGKSGTGKSYQSINVCRERRISGIIDDGLFIYGNTIQAGHSAKRDENKIKAIRTAIFDDPAERDAVAGKIREVQPDSILVIGTSDAMILKICERLGLPEPEEILQIEDISDSDDITTALRQRREKGKHVIPAPTFEVKSQFSGYFLAPLRFFFNNNGKTEQGDEKSVVRPTYSYLGRFTIADSAVSEMIEYVCMRCRGVAEVQRCTVRTESDGVTLSASVILTYGEPVHEMVERLQRTLSEEVSRMTAFNILSIDINVRGLQAGRGISVSREAAAEMLQ